MVHGMCEAPKMTLVLLTKEFSNDSPDSGEIKNLEAAFYESLVGPGYVAFINESDDAG